MATTATGSAICVLERSLDIKSLKVSLLDSSGFIEYMEIISSNWIFVDQ